MLDVIKLKKTFCLNKKKMNSHKYMGMQQIKRLGSM